MTYDDGFLNIKGAKNYKMNLYGSTAPRMHASTYIGRTFGPNVTSAFTFGQTVSSGINSYKYLSGESDGTRFTTDVAFDTGGNALTALTGVGVTSTLLYLSANPYVAATAGGVFAIATGLGYGYITEPYRQAVKEQQDTWLEENIDGYNDKITPVQKAKRYKGISTNPLRYMGMFY